MRFSLGITFTDKNLLTCENVNKGRWEKETFKMVSMILKFDVTQH